MKINKFKKWIKLTVTWILSDEVNVLVMVPSGFLYSSMMQFVMLFSNSLVIIKLLVLPQSFQQTLFFWGSSLFCRMTCLLFHGPLGDVPAAISYTCNKVYILYKPLKKSLKTFLAFRFSFIRFLFVKYMKSIT